MQKMFICSKTTTKLAVLVLLGVALLATCDESSVSENEIEAEKSETSNNNNSDDYFYDASLSEAEIKKIQEEKRRVEEEREKEEAAKRPAEEKEPEWFARGNNTDDPMAKFMEEAIKDYMKRMQKEYMEKMKSKKKSDINHQFWSVVTLAIFFGTGILIGLAIVVVRGNSFNKGTRLNGAAGANGKKKPVNGRDSINRSAYVSVPQKEQITI